MAFVEWTSNAFQQNSIRQGYWSVHRIAMVGSGMTQSDPEGMASPSHIRHCLDLLRQSLMCYIDTTIEIQDPGTRGVHGFGVQHQCQDWDQLTKLVDGWQS